MKQVGRLLPCLYLSIYCCICDNLCFVSVALWARSLSEEWERCLFHSSSAVAEALHELDLG